MGKNLTYKDAGVDIKAGDKTVNYIKPLAKSTYTNEVISGIGGFSGLFKLPKEFNNKDSILVASTDGVGTKLKLAFKSNNHKTIGIDLFAMCVNDIICCGAKPLFFLDYFATGKLKPEKAKEVVKGIAKACKDSKCVLLGGETAELPGFYKANEYDLAGFVVGVVNKKKIVDGSKIKVGDTLIGIESSGLHSNGYSLAQKVFEKAVKGNWNRKLKGLKKSIGKELLTPTHIYVNIIEKLTKKYTIKGIANITGGGLTENIPRVLPKNTSCKINLNSWKRSNLFNLLKEYGKISDKEMLRTFNSGIGIVLIVNKKDEKKILNDIQKTSYKAFKIGSVIKGSKKVVYEGDY